MARLKKFYAMTSIDGENGSADLLAEDHDQLDGLLRSLFKALDQGDKAAAFNQLDLLWACLAMHIRAEHLCLFPAVLEALAGRQQPSGGGTPSLTEARQIIARLRADHDFFMRELAGAVKLMRELQAAPEGDSESDSLRGVRQSIAALSDRLAAHNSVEEERVYRWPAMLLDPAEQSALMGRVRREINNLPPRFDRDSMIKYR